MGYPKGYQTESIKFQNRQTALNAGWRPINPLVDFRDYHPLTVSVKWISLDDQMSEEVYFEEWQHHKGEKPSESMFRPGWEGFQGWG